MKFMLYADFYYCIGFGDEKKNNINKNLKIYGNMGCLKT